MGSGEWSVGSREWAVESGEWSVGSREWTVECGVWGVDSGECDRERDLPLRR